MRNWFWRIVITGSTLWVGYLAGMVFQFTVAYGQSTPPSSGDVKGPGPVLLMRTAGQPDRKVQVVSQSNFSDGESLAEVRDLTSGKIFTLPGKMVQMLPRADEMESQTMTSSQPKHHPEPAATERVIPIPQQSFIPEKPSLMKPTTVPPAEVPTPPVNATVVQTQLPVPSEPQLTMTPRPPSLPQTPKVPVITSTPTFKDVLPPVPSAERPLIQNSRWRPLGEKPLLMPKVKLIEPSSPVTGDRWRPLREAPAK
jgi:hypothetical protein